MYHNRIRGDCPYKKIVLRIILGRVFVDNSTAICYDKSRMKVCYGGN